MLLARAGYRVLLVDRATFPSDTMSTHYIHQPGVARLARWGLLDEVRATGCPPISQTTVDFGDLALSGFGPPYEDITSAYCPRRTVLDEILVRAAAAAGAEVRESFVVDEIVGEGDAVAGIRGRSRDGESIVERARIVVGADGMRSPVARAVGAPSYDDVPPLACGYYAYFSDLPLTGNEFLMHPHRVMGAFPTNDGLTCVFCQWHVEDFHEFRADIEGNFLRSADQVPAFGERLRAAARETRFVGASDVPNFFRKPWGPGWALVGDAGYHKDPITAQGITDAFRDVEILAAAIDDGLAGRRPMEETLAGYERARNAAAKPFYDWTTTMAAMQPRPPEVMAILRAVKGNAEQTTRLFGMTAELVTPAEFFAPANVAAIMAAAG